jgi:dipeptidyl aminopeptidase/acylaminoacyl peptidase
MGMKALRLVLLALSLLGLVTALGGCGGGSGAPIFLNIYQRAAWEQVTNGRITMTAYGGNGLLYVYIIGDTGGNPTLLTPSLNNIYDLMEGGQHPVFAPPVNLTTASPTICFASRRAIGGNSGASLALYTMSSTTGDAQEGNTPGLVRITNDTSIGADTEPNYSPDGKTIIYSTTRGSSSTQGQIWTASADGSGHLQQLVNAPGMDDEWPCYNPKNANQIVFQRSASNLAGTTAQIVTCNLTTKVVTPITPSSLSTYANGAPSWSPDGTTIAFHSNPGGNYNIFTLRLADGKLTNVTNDSRSDGFPVWDPTSLYLAFTRDRELWTTTVDGLTQLQLTRRF